MDTFSAHKRSEVMGRIRSVDTAPELKVRQMLHRDGFRFRLHDSRLPGKPDIVLKKYKTAIYVHGCFWHSHDGCRRGGHRPKSNTNYWNPKIDRNVLRDKMNSERLAAMGWKQIVVWECELKNPETVAKRIRAELTNG